MVFLVPVSKISHTCPSSSSLSGSRVISLFDISTGEKNTQLLSNQYLLTTKYLVFVMLVSIFCIMVRPSVTVSQSVLDELWFSPHCAPPYSPTRLWQRRVSHRVSGFSPTAPDGNVFPWQTSWACNRDDSLPQSVVGLNRGTGGLLCLVILVQLKFLKIGTGRWVSQEKMFKWKNISDISYEAIRSKKQRKIKAVWAVLRLG